MQNLEKIAEVEKKEYRRLCKIYKNLPQKKRELAEGLIRQAARLKARLDSLWDDIKANGDYEEFTQSEKVDPYGRERPASKTFTATDKSYQSIIKQLTDMLPPETASTSLDDPDTW